MNIFSRHLEFAIDQSCSPQRGEILVEINQQLYQHPSGVQCWLNIRPRWGRDVCRICFSINI
jgi:hypothetical protein